MITKKVFEKISFTIVSLVALFLSLRNIYGEDIGFHLHAGRWMIQNFSLPPNEIFTYTSNGIQYIDLNWLYQLLMYGIYSIGGSVGLILINSIFIVATLFFLFKQIKNSSVFLPWFFLLAIITASPLFEIRPHSVSWLLMSITLFILQKYFDGNEKMIRWLPVAMLLWVNIHSLFILGLVVLACYFASIYCLDKKFYNQFLLFASLSVLVCFLNPFGWKGFIFPFEQVLALKSGNIFKENIRELQNPFSSKLYEEGFFHAIFHSWIFFDLFCTIAFLSLIIGYKRMRVHEWLLFFIFLFFAYSATKNIGYFIFAVAPIVVANFLREKNSAKHKNKQEKISFLEKYSLYIFSVFVLLCFILILSIRTNAFYIHYRSSYRFGFGWSNENLPVKATGFLVKNNLNGKILNQLDFGGYLEFFVNQKVSIDGRLDFVGENNFSEQVALSTDDSKQKLISKLNPDVIIFSYYSAPDWLTFLQKQSGWRCVYVDGNAALYLKNNYAEKIPAITEKDLLSGIQNFSDEQIDKLMKEKQDAGFFSSLFHPQYFPDEEHNLIAFCFYYNWGNAAKQFSANAFQKATSDYPEMYQNLGSIYFQFRDKNRSLFCYEKYLSKKKNEQVQKRVEFLKNCN